MIEAQREHQCAEPQRLRALGRGREKHARRWRKAERRAVMLGEVIAVEAGAIAGFQDLQAGFVLGRRVFAGPVHVIEQAKPHAPSLFSSFRYPD